MSELNYLSKQISLSRTGLKGLWRLIFRIWLAIVILLACLILIYSSAFPLLLLDIEFDVVTAAIINAGVLFILTYWVFKRFTNIQKFYIRAPLYILILLLTVGPLNYHSMNSNRINLSSTMQIDGYGMRGFNILFLSTIGQSGLSFIYDSLPLIVSYPFRLADESMFIMDFVKSIEDSDQCPGLNGTCADYTLAGINNKNRTSTYYVLETALKARLVFRERKELKKEDSEGKYRITKKLSSYSLDVLNRSLKSQYSRLQFEQDILKRFQAITLNRIDDLNTKASKKCKKEKCSIDLSSQKIEIQNLKREISSVSDHPEKNSEKSEF